MSVLPTRLNVMPREATPSSPAQVNPPSLQTPEELGTPSNTLESKDTFESDRANLSTGEAKKDSWFLPIASATLGSFVGSVMLAGEEVGSFRKFLAPAIGAGFGVLGTLLAVGQFKKKPSTPSPDSTSI